MSQPGRKQTYRFVFSVAAAGAGAFLQIAGAANKIQKIRMLKLSKPSAGVTVSVARRSAPATGGTTGTAPTVVKHDTTSLTPGFAVTVYTGAPTAGTLVGKIEEQALATTDIYVYDPGNDPEQPITLRSGEYLTLDTSAAATVNGTVVVTEEDA